jgi:hypothetical protein
MMDACWQHYVQTMAELQANYLPGAVCVMKCVTAVPTPYAPWQHYVQTIAELQANFLPGLLHCDCI